MPVLMIPVSFLLPFDMPKDAQLVKLSVAVLIQAVVLKVSMHCKGCARKVKKHISEMEGDD